MNANGSRLYHVINSWLPEHKGAFSRCSQCKKARKISGYKLPRSKK